MGEFHHSIVLELSEYPSDRVTSEYGTSLPCLHRIDEIVRYPCVLSPRPVAASAPLRPHSLPGWRSHFRCQLLFCIQHPELEADVSKLKVFLD
jgi:hypothetical protein